MTTVTSIATAMFSVADQDAAIALYTDKLGWELRSETSFGEGDAAGRWVEVGEQIGGEGPVPRMFSVNDPDGNWIWVVQGPS